MFENDLPRGVKTSSKNKFSRATTRGYLGNQLFFVRGGHFVGDE